MHKFSVAPMMDWTDKHCRYFYRLLSKNANLYTEMISTQAILYGDKNRLLDYHKNEHPLALQLGGSDPAEMAKCAKIAQKWEYDEVNINVGCPSQRVQSGSFGACLMKTPEIVGKCVDAMKQATTLPITVKTRLGVDDMDSFAQLSDFIDSVHQHGCDTFIIHARKAWLKGLSAKQNRTVPPLNYDWAYQLKQDFPSLNIVLNGGVENLSSAQHHLKKIDGVMLGRAVYHQPYLLSGVDAEFYHQPTKPPTREQVLLDFIDYIKVQNSQNVPTRAMTRHILGLYHGEKNAKKFKRLLSAKTVKIANLYQWLKFSQAA